MPFISPLDPADTTTEVVERKGLGHPDTICDALAEELSRNLCREYVRRFGSILHHNVDKALLAGGAPSHNLVAAVSSVLSKSTSLAEQFHDLERCIPLQEMAVEGSRSWLRTNLRALDPIQHASIQTLIQPGSADLSALFSRRSNGDSPLANDTSIGVGYAPMSSLEQLVLAIERHINPPNGGRGRPAWGEDVKVMGIRTGNVVRLSIACAMIGS